MATGNAMRRMRPCPADRPAGRPARTLQVAVTHLGQIAMKTVANLMMGLGMLMLIGYAIIGWKSGGGWVHSPFVMFPAGLVLVTGGAIARFLLPRM
ncbi:hypothetical protein JCM19379_13410 [Methyloparacoccus murrellii]